VRLVNFFTYLKADWFLLGITCYIFGNPGSKVAWSCRRRGSNPVPSDSQPDAMTISHGDPKLDLNVKIVISPAFSISPLSTIWYARSGYQYFQEKPIKRLQIKYFIMDSLSSKINKRFYKNPGHNCHWMFMHSDWKVRIPPIILRDYAANSI